MHASRTAAALTLAVATTLAACADSTTGPRSDITPAVVDPPPVIAAAGDIADSEQTGERATALLLDGIQPDIILALGDLAYEDGTLAQFNSWYQPTWGRHKSLTRPAPGNHEYHTSGAAGYFDYFGALAGPNRRGYYSFNLGAWHLLSLNSNVAAGAGSAQLNFVRSDLAANPTACALAFWHHPVFSSGPHGNNSHMREIWRVLDSAGVDVVLVGHDHTYERFAPQTSTGAADPNGVREFVVGTGGRGLYSWATIRANSQVRNNTTWGVLTMTLHPTSYDWNFVPIAGRTFTDQGSANCVQTGTTPPPPTPNQPPTVSLTAPPNGATFTAPATITLTATASDPDNNLARVEFLQGTTVLGSDASAPYSFTWTNVAAGSYGLTARAVDAANASTTSAEARVTVNPAAPPPPAGGIRNVTNGWDSKSRKTLVQDGKLADVVASDNDWYEIEAREFLSLEFANIASDATIQSVKLHVEHHEEQGFTSGSAIWQVGGGALASPFAAMEMKPPTRLGEGNETTVVWDVTPWVRRADRANDLVLIVRNIDPEGKKIKIDRAFLEITLGPTPAASPSAFEVTLFVIDGWDAKNGKSLLQDGKVYLVNASDGDRSEIEAGYFTSYQFQGIPATAVVESSKIFVEHYEETGMSPTAVTWEASVGSMSSPSMRSSRVPALLAGEANEAMVEWNVSSPFGSASMVRDLKLVVRNRDSNGKKAMIGRAYVVVTHRDP